ncbi:Glycoside hydrolase family 16 protein [Pleurostoma richardsiae]|uniref:Glycoside hydrolase family 16 protein n=1 Tax=Pleurostoma richardsiae TaxID=41990 RepID=A0AA38RR51_9PEZI|nr:Glycoside hydrolase family 16 protein [Pleurostoma richardsiae]
MRFEAFSLLLLLPAMVSAVAAPAYPSLGQPFWQDTFSGAAGSSPNSDNWNYALGINTNNEAETYTTSNNNVQISGGNTVQFIPRKSASGVWTSARIESKKTFTPAAGKIMQIEASIRMGGNSAAEMQGIWPAVWMLGDSIHHGTEWPACGELDIFEQVNGLLTAYGTAHCTTCNEPTGRGGQVATDNSEWHTYAIKVDRTSNNWATESVTWLRDGVEYFTLTGATVADEGTWGTLAHSPLFLILNLAVGGDFPGAPNSATADGYGSMMEVEYVAAYST